VISADRQYCFTSTALSTMMEQSEKFALRSFDNKHRPEWLNRRPMPCHAPCLCGAHRLHVPSQQRVQAGERLSV
jgi:hypothetical protein